ncbi:hypothetical protein [Lederbergia lenta]|uniref:Uncharacterized protein n=1 Tax=Lederbergia lenta TaxID=1467 RepID=A0A2X4WYA9_LEDLE|nr:hypothetical protein [Lederbergia lenta]MEC2323084.1 hypothetical protein [Lederbergia lenta]SQI62680.1 Uncharacterised protein [Lederbergia lenta]
MVTFKKENNKHIISIENNEVVVDPQRIEEGHFLAIINYVDEDGKFLEAELFYHPEEKEVDAFLESLKLENFQKHKLTEGLFAKK